MLPVQTSAHLQQLQALMQELSLWQATPIDESALLSTAPFACDTMSFAQWLQFIFIPKMQQLLALGLSLPDAIALAPMAEQAWQGQAQYLPLIQFLQQLDEYLS
ncbi:MAG: YqcC family protein [Shewanella sp.]